MSTLRRAHLWAAVVVCVFAGALVIATFALPGTSIPGACAWAAFGLTFPIFGAAVGTSRLPTRRSSRDFSARRELSRLSLGQVWRQVRERIPRAAAVAIAATCVFGWAATMTGLFQLTGGNPERQGNHYFSDNHGALTPLTQAEYERHLAAEYRTFAGASMTLCAVAVGLILAGPPRPDSVRGQESNGAPG